ncbi:MAG TPA: acetyl-CoA hydrolase/transferase C-terminal domain-containing protein [Thermodesulfobacteriota bacterium]|nr:acetyl-CoA hydrolase/transferase C-terminal domain-containing protein [Thermodesulfobacteriota bacterium]
MDEKEFAAERIRNGELRSRVCRAEEAASFFRDGMLVATSGNALTGFPRAVFGALAERVKAGSPLKVDLLCSGPLGPEVEDALVEAGAMRRRIGTVGSRMLRQAINRGNVGFIEGKTGRLSLQARRGYFGKIDVAVVEIAGINEKGDIIPGISVYDAPDWLELASSIILEINVSRPLKLEGIHDIYLPRPGTPIPLSDPLGRIGSPFMTLDPAKVRHIVISGPEERETPASAEGPQAEAIARNLISFVRQEASRNGAMPPIEVGIGEVMKAFLSALGRSEFSSLVFYLAAATDPILDLVDAGKVKGVCCNSLRFSGSVLKRFYAGLEDYRRSFVMRPVTLTNSAEMLNRFGVLSVNTGLEADIQAQVNSRHARGSQLVGGIAGSYDFARNGSVSIFALPSKSPRGSNIVPVVSHVDHTEHEVDVLVTEHGFADLRALEPFDRARRIIENCADPAFRDGLNAYVEKARRNTGRMPIVLPESG